MIPACCYASRVVDRLFSFIFLCFQATWRDIFFSTQSVAICSKSNECKNILYSISDDTTASGWNCREEYEKCHKKWSSTRNSHDVFPGMIENWDESVNISQVLWQWGCGSKHGVPPVSTLQSTKRRVSAWTLTFIFSVRNLKETVSYVSSWCNPSVPSNFISLPPLLSGLT